MDEGLKEYIKSLIPHDFPDGRGLLEEGRAIGKGLKIPKNLFLQKYGYDTYLDYRKDCTAKGKIVWQLLVGLSTLEEELDAIRQLSDFSDRTGLNIKSMQSIPSSLVGLPLEYWENAPKPTSYLMKEEADWQSHSDAAPVQVVWQDWHLACPNCLETTLYALKAGTPRLGTFSQLIWNYPGWDDEVNRFSDMVRSIGVIASKRDDFISVDTYPEDGMPGYFLDVVSYVGYMMLEHYIISNLCGARMSISFGGLLTDIQPRMAFAMAMHKLYGSYDEPILSYYNGGTTDQWDHDIESNYGIGVQEMLIQILVELKYKMHTAISPVAVTERLRVPTLDELLNIAAAGARAEEKAHEWLPLMDFTPLEALRDELIERGTVFYFNIMNAFEEAGVDIKDPLQMIMMIKRFNPTRFEMSFHPSIREKGEFIPYYPNRIGKETLAMYEQKTRELSRKKYDSIMNGRKTVVASADGHSYGLLYIEKVLQGLGTNVLNCGVDASPADLLDLADEEDTDLIMISIHCGQVLDYCSQLLNLSELRGKKYRFFVGGMLNAMLPGNTEPIDVTDRLREMGIHAYNDLEDSIKLIASHH